MLDSVRRSTITRRLGRRPIASATAGAEPTGTTWHTTAAAPTAFTRIRLIFESVESSTIGISSAAVAVTSSLASHPTPSTGTWVPVTFDGGSASGTMPVGYSLTNQSVYKSDWITISSIARVDKYFEPYPLLMARVYFAGSGYSTLQVTGRLPGWSESPQSFGQSWKTSSQVIDGVSTPASFTSSVDRGTNVLIGFECDTIIKGATVLAIGDSITTGYKSAYDVRSGAAIVCGLLGSIAEPIGFINRGCDGSMSVEYIAAGLQALTDYSPSIAIYTPVTPNETLSSQSVADNMLSRANTFTAACITAGVVPILTTGTPNDMLSGSAYDIRAGLNTSVLALASSSVFVADTNAAMSDGANPERIIARYGSGDLVHPLNPGYEAYARALLPVARQAIFGY